jgi:hypothetical protein
MNNKVNAYFISGLGADSRAFHKIQLPKKFTVKHIHWISPLKNEPLNSYCLRLAEQIDTSKPFVLIGLSFGGIIIAELSKTLKPLKSIIISSVSGSGQLPWYFKALGRSGIHKIIPPRFFKSGNPLSAYAFGTKSDDEKTLLKQIVKDIDEKYLKWAINAILTWNSTKKPQNLIHIHGTQDKTFPIRFVQPDIPIEGGRHLMILSMADTINEILKRELESV